MANYRTGTGAMNLDSAGRKNMFKKGGARRSARVFTRTGGGRMVY